MSGSFALLRAAEAHPLLSRCLHFVVCFVSLVWFLVSFPGSCSVSRPGAGDGKWENGSLKISAFRIKILLHFSIFDEILSYLRRSGLERRYIAGL